MGNLGIELITRTQHGIYNLETLDSHWEQEFMQSFFIYINQCGGRFTKNYNLFICEHGRGFYVFQYGKLLYNSDFDIMTQLSYVGEEERAELLNKLIEDFDLTLTNRKYKPIEDSKLLDIINEEIIDTLVYSERNFTFVYG